MKILFLGSGTSTIVKYLRKQKHQVDTTMAPLVYRKVRFTGYDFLISYGYRHIVDAKILTLFPYNNAVNLHISMLPYNRGADPNLWSWIDRTPKGVTIHLMTEKLDEGEILAQNLLPLSNGETLASSYKKLNDAVIHLFKFVWPALSSGNIKPERQLGDGSYHKSSDREKVQHLLTKGWDTPVSELKREF